MRAFRVKALNAQLDKIPQDVVAAIHAICREKLTTHWSDKLELLNECRDLTKLSHNLRVMYRLEHWETFHELLVYNFILSSLVREEVSKDHWGRLCRIDHTSLISLKEHFKGAMREDYINKNILNKLSTTIPPWLRDSKRFNQDVGTPVLKQLKIAADNLGFRICNHVAALGEVRELVDVYSKSTDPIQIQMYLLQQNLIDKELCMKTDPVQELLRN